MIKKIETTEDLEKLMRRLRNETDALSVFDSMVEAIEELVPLDAKGVKKLDKLLRDIDKRGLNEPETALPEQRTWLDEQGYALLAYAQMPLYFEYRLLVEPPMGRRDYWHFEFVSAPEVEKVSLDEIVDDIIDKMY